MRIAGEVGSTPAANFPAVFLTFVPLFAQGGTTINGVTAPRWPMAPANDDERF